MRSKKEILEEIINEQNEVREALEPLVIAVKKIDDSIEFFKKELKTLEALKQNKLKEINDIFELALINQYRLPCGFTVQSGNRYKVEINDTQAFLKWLKLNCEPQEVLKFFGDGLKETSIKEFAQDKVNEMRLKGEINPTIDGLDVKGLTYRRLTTKRGM